MATERLESILNDLTDFFKFELKPDENNACLIQFKSGMELQIEMDRYENFLVGIRLATIPGSRYLENVLREALKSNHKFPASSGVFGYSRRSNRLIYFLMIESKLITKEKILALLPAFIEKGQNWFDILQKGGVPIVETQSSGSKSNIFGIR